MRIGTPTQNAYLHATSRGRVVGQETPNTTKTYPRHQANMFTIHIRRVQELGNDVVRLVRHFFRDLRPRDVCS